MTYSANCPKVTRPRHNLDDARAFYGEGAAALQMVAVGRESFPEVEPLALAPTYWSTRSLGVD